MHPVHTETRDGFDIAFYALPEDSDPADHFDIQGDDDRTFELIANGTYAWFCAKVTASKGGVELGCDYLGGCCYDSEVAFVTDSGYYEDMVASAIDEARKAIARINS